MSWHSNLCAIIALLLLAACGFKPLYGKRATDNQALYAGVQIDPIAGGRPGQLLKINLEDRLNPSGKIPPSPRYRLSATLLVSAAPVDIARDGTISRYNVYIDSTYILYRTSDNTQITTGRLRHVSSYSNVTNDYYSTYISQEDAIRRGITELSDDYRLRLSSLLSKEETAAKPHEDEVAPKPIPALP